MEMTWGISDDFRLGPGALGSPRKASAAITERPLPEQLTPSAEGRFLALTARSESRSQMAAQGRRQTVAERTAIV
jgi:hypothetical protein